LSEADQERTTLVFVRHGESEGNRDRKFGGHGPTPLTDQGLRQADATAAILGPAGATAVVSSDLVRARQTATPIAKVLGLDLGFDEGLRERGLGVLDGMGFEQAKREHPNLWAKLVSRDTSWCPPEGETVDSVFERVSTTIDRIVDGHRGGRVVVVSHGLALFHAFAHVCGLGSPSAGLKVFVLVDNCSISTVLHHHEYGWQIKHLNRTAHLDEV
jgi:probable phosphoglycerate mutase